MAGVRNRPRFAQGHRIWLLRFLCALLVVCAVLALNFGFELLLLLPFRIAEKPSLRVDVKGLSESTSSDAVNFSAARDDGNEVEQHTVEGTLEAGAALEQNAPIEDPCIGRPTPPPLPADATSPPSLFFLHIPKTAGTLMYRLVMQYASKTNGLACNFLYDGNRCGPEEFQMSVLPPPTFPEGSLGQKAVAAYSKRNKTAKLELYRQGACRAFRGHVTFRHRDVIEAPVLSLVVVRDPLERFVSMYEFVLSMVRARPDATGWDRWVSNSSLAEEFGNASSILNHGFYDEKGQWIANNNVGFSFHFYGVLHQLSGMNPIFEGVRSPFLFGISNTAEMAEKAKDNLCSSHVVGSQSDMHETIRSFRAALEPYAQWTEDEAVRWESSSVNKNADRQSRDVDDHMPANVRAELERRLRHEIEVVSFAEQIVAYRKFKAIAR